jgi:hypothetical protein
MKTLDEALDTICGEKRSEADIDAESSRFESLVHEVYRNARIADFIGRAIGVSIKDPKSQGDVFGCVIQACTVCYLTGIKIGMEMERQDLAV